MRALCRISRLVASPSHRRWSTASGVATPQPTLFTKTHEVFTRSGEASSSVASGDVTLTVGLSERALDLIGDVKRVEPLVALGATAPAGSHVAHVHWDGYRRTASDELYHAVWAHAKDVRRVGLPFAATVLAFNSDEAAVTSKHGWIVKVRAAAADVLRAGLLDEEAYTQHCIDEEKAEDARASQSYP